jgi:hypothetical protein
MGFVQSRRFAVLTSWALGFVSAYLAATFDLSPTATAAIGVVCGVAIAVMSEESKEAS